MNKEQFKVFSNILSTIAAIAAAVLFNLFPEYEPAILLMCLAIYLKE